MNKYINQPRRIPPIHRIPPSIGILGDPCGMGVPLAKYQLSKISAFPGSYWPAAPAALCVITVVICHRFIGATAETLRDEILDPRVDSVHMGHQVRIHRIAHGVQHHINTLDTC